MWEDREHGYGGCHPGIKTPQWEARIKNRDNRRRNKRMKNGR